jgi:hypothetical protein
MNDALLYCAFVTFCPADPDADPDPDPDPAGFSSSSSRRRRIDDDHDVIHPAIQPSSHPSLSLKIHCYAFITVYVMAQMSKYQKMHESYSKSVTFLPQRSLED